MGQWTAMVAVTVVALLVVPGAGPARGDWPQFGGLNRDGVSEQGGLARQWPESGPAVLWRVELGEGFGGMAVQGGEVFILDRLIDEDGDVLRCLDLATGAERWRLSYPTRGRFQYPGSRSTPTVTQSHVYTVGAFGHLHCFDRQQQSVVWSRHMEEFDGEPPNWGYGQSALLVEEKLIVAPMSRSTGLVALNHLTGEVIWRTPDIGGDAYSSPLLTELDGVKQVLMLTSAGLTSVDPATGAILWRHRGYRVRNAIPTPTVLGDGRIFLTGGYRAGSQMIRVSRSGETWRVEEVFRLDDGSMLHNAVLHEGHLFANLNTNENLRGTGGRRRPGGGGQRGGGGPGGTGPMGMACLDLAGNVLWRTGMEPHIDRGSFLIADGLVIVLGGQDGVLHLLEATPTDLRPVASAPLFDDPGANLWAPLALSQGRLLARSQGELVCVDLSQR